MFHMDTTTAGLPRQITAQIREAMAAAGVSQRELATRTGLPLVTLNRRLTGTGKPFDLQELLSITATLGLSLTDVVLRAERAVPVATPVDTPGAA